MQVSGRKKSGTQTTGVFRIAGRRFALIRDKVLGKASREDGALEMVGGALGGECYHLPQNST